MGVQCTPISAPQRRREYTWIGGGFKSSMLPRLDTQSVTSILSVEILGVRCCPSYIAVRSLLTGQVALVTF